MSIGPIMCDLNATKLTKEEYKLIQNPLIGGIILFSRNYESPDQLQQLVYEIRNARRQPILIAVDQEGGRVQRFIDGFTKLPAFADFGKAFDADCEKALSLVEKAGWLMASEILAVGIDFSFTPVLDLNKGISEVIGERSFHQDPEAVILLANAFIKGMNRAGMQAVGKHYPGHGGIAADSHTSLPIDDREPEEILNIDIIPFIKLAHHRLQAIMPAHIVFKHLDDQPVTFSKFWLQQLLRKEIGFQGAIISDDLSMAGAASLGDYPQRALQALQAGCDMLLICNNRNGVNAVLEKLTMINPLSSQRLLKLCGHFRLTRQELQAYKIWHDTSEMITHFVETKSLEEVI